MKRIDGVEVTSTERDEAEDAYVNQVLKFNEKIEQVRPLALLPGPRLRYRDLQGFGVRVGVGVGGSGQAVVFPSWTHSQASLVAERETCGRVTRRGTQAR